MDLVSKGQQVCCSDSRPYATRNNDLAFVEQTLIEERKILVVYTQINVKDMDLESTPISKRQREHNEEEEWTEQP